MSLVKNLKQNAGMAIVAGGAGVGGAFAGRMLADSIGSPNGGQITETFLANARKRLNITRGVMVAFGIAGFAAVKGTDTVSTAIKSAALGNAIVNGLDLAADLLKSEANALPNNTAGKALRAGLGLGCPCNGGVAENRYYPSLAQPIIDPMEGMTMSERISYRDAMLGRSGANPLLQVNENAWQTAIAS